MYYLAILSNKTTGQKEYTTQDTESKLREYCAKYYSNWSINVIFEVNKSL